MKRRYYRLGRILRTVYMFYGITIDEIAGTSRKGHIVQARHIYNYIAYEHGYTYIECANFINKDRNSSRHSVEEIKNQLASEEFSYDKNTFNDVDHLLKKCYRFRKIRRKK